MASQHIYTYQAQHYDYPLNTGQVLLVLTKKTLIRVQVGFCYWDVINRSIGPSVEADWLPSGLLRLLSVVFEDQMNT